MKPRKLRVEKDGTVPPLRRLKQSSPEDRAWAFELRQGCTNEQARAMIKDRLGIELRRDGQLSEFYSWQLQQREWDKLGEIMESDEAALRDRFPAVSLDKIRGAAIKRSYATAELMGDPKFRLKVIAVDQAEQTGRFRASIETLKVQERAKDRELDERRVRLLEQKAAQRDQAAAVMQEKLSPAEKQAKLRAIFGME